MSTVEASRHLRVGKSLEQGPGKRGVQDISPIRPVSVSPFHPAIGSPVLRFYLYEAERQ